MCFASRAARPASGRAAPPRWRSPPISSSTCSWSRSTHMSDQRLSEGWPSLFRFMVGLYWLYFASTKWNGVEWVKGLMQAAGPANPIPGLKEILTDVVAPNWFLFAVAQTVGETVVGVLLVVGLATRWAAIGAVLLAMSLALVVAFEVSDPGFRWL